MLSSVEVARLSDPVCYPLLHVSTFIYEFTVSVAALGKHMYVQSTCLSLLFSVPHPKSQNVCSSLIAPVPKKAGNSSRARAETDKSKLESYLRNMGWALQMIMVPNKTITTLYSSLLRT